MKAAGQLAPSRRIVELRRVGFLSKGAELMLLPILARLRARYSGREFALAPAPEAPFGPRGRLGLWQKWELNQPTSVRLSTCVLAPLVEVAYRQVFPGDQ